MPDKRGPDHSRAAMMTRRRQRSALRKLAYAASLCLVLSFVLFEVLDIDGSDFAVPLRAEVTIKLAEPSDDIRRDYLELVELELVDLPSIAPPPAAVGVALHWLERLQQAPSLPGSRAAQVRSRNSRTTLPRASLDDDRSYTS